MGYKVDCANCLLQYNPNNHECCPFCGTKLEQVKVFASVNSQANETSIKRTMGPVGWYFLIFLFSAIVGGLLTLNEAPDSPNPNSGYQDEWNADNSIDGPNGTFDGQSKP
jgi:hypothetical protein